MEIYKIHFPGVLEELSRIIRDNNIPISSIAEATGLSRPTIYKLLKGKRNLTITTIEKIIQALSQL